MKIVSFNKYILNEVMQNYELKDCSLVIDGHNYFYRSCEDSKLCFIFGPEGNEYANYLREKLDIFKQARVKCYIVFKGGDTDKQKKFQKLTESIKGHLNNEYDPVFIMKDIWKQVLEEQGINYSICIAEAKDDCVALANTLGCSILSNDIEYCFRNAPYISSDTIKFDTKERYINCKQYLLKHFLENHKLTENKAAIFAALSDKTIIPNTLQERLFKKWNVFSKNFVIRHKALLKWLSNNSENNILAKISEFLPKETYVKFVNYMKKVLRNMQNVNPSLITDYLLNDPPILTVKQLDPLWLEKGVTMQNIPIEYINLYKNKLFIINTSVLDAQIVMFFDILVYAYNLLANFNNTEISIYFNNNKNIININTCNFNVTKPRYECYVSVFENGWADIKNLQLFHHFLTENNINIGIILKLSEEARMLFIALTYFARKKMSEGIDVTKEVNCFIISYVMLNIIFDIKGSLTKEVNGITENNSSEATRATAKYFKCTPEESELLHDATILKTLVEIQFCIVQMNNLNILCGCPYETTKYHRTLNGTFIYKLFLGMHDYNENEFIVELFESAPSVQQCIKKLITTYKELVYF